MSERELRKNQSMYIEKPGQLVQNSSVADSSYFKHAECVRRFNLLLEFVVGGLNQVDEDLNQDFMIQEYLQIVCVLHEVATPSQYSHYSKVRIGSGAVYW